MSVGARVALVALLGGLLAALLWALSHVPARGVGLWGMVEPRLATAGAENAVTAVLLNFRGYDTLLEMVVLLLALLSIWSLHVSPLVCPAEPAGHVLRFGASLLVPLMIVVAGYLLWAGAARAGGAFQSGAVIASAGILLLLADSPVLGGHALAVRVGITLGVVVFLGVGLACLMAGYRFLEYPSGLAKSAIILIEMTAAVSIGLVLAGAFAASRRVLMRGYGPREEA